MSILINELKDKMWAASSLASSMNENGLPSNYKSRSEYLKVGFSGDLYGYVGNDPLFGKIHKGYIGIANSDVIIAFAGTEGVGDWINDFLAYPKNFPFGTGNVHTGFLNAVLSISENLIKKVSELTGSKKCSFYVTGHSKGGAMAVLMAAILKSKLQSLIESIKVVTFGAPRVGDKTFKDNYTISVTRYEANLDVVPHLPLTEKEGKLFPAFSTITDIMAPMLDFPPYCSIGERISIEKSHGKYSGYPEDVNTTNGEALNSYYSSFRLLTAMEMSLIGDIHTGDYK